MDKICCDYKICDNHPGDGECDLVGIFIDENGMCGKMFPAVQQEGRHLSEASTRQDNIAANISEIFRKGGTVREVMNYLNTCR